MKRSLTWLPLAVAAMGAAAELLRSGLYLLGTDEKGLLIPGHPLEIVLWLLTAAAAVLIILSVWRQTDSRSYSENFPRSTVACAGCIVFAAGFAAATAANGFDTFRPMDRICSIAGLLAAVALIAVAVFRKLGKRPFFLLHAVVCLALTLYTVSHYSGWSSRPQLIDAFYAMIGCLGLMMFAYYQTAFDAGMGSRRMQLASGLLAAFTCFAAIPESSSAVLYLTGGIWTLTNLCALTPPVTKEMEDAQ